MLNATTVPREPSSVDERVQVLSQWLANQRAIPTSMAEPTAWLIIEASRHKALELSGPKAPFVVQPRFALWLVGQLGGPALLHIFSDEQAARAQAVELGTARGVPVLMIDRGGAIAERIEPTPSTPQVVVPAVRVAPPVAPARATPSGVAPPTTAFAPKVVTPTAMATPPRPMAAASPAHVAPQAPSTPVTSAPAPVMSAPAPVTPAPAAAAPATPVAQTRQASPTPVTLVSPRPVSSTVAPVAPASTASLGAVKAAPANPVAVAPTSPVKPVPTSPVKPAPVAPVALTPVTPKAQPVAPVAAKLASAPPKETPVAAAATTPAPAVSLKVARHESAWAVFLGTRVIATAPTRDKARARARALKEDPAFMADPKPVADA